MLQSSCSRESSISGAASFKLQESISSLPCLLLPLIVFTAFLGVSISIFFILNFGVGSGLLLSQVLSHVVGYNSTSVVVFCLRVVILFLKNLLKIVAIVSGFVINSGESSPFSWCTIADRDRFFTVPTSSLAGL